MATISFSIDDDMKRQLEEMCDGMGLSLTVFFKRCTENALKKRKIPLDDDIFYSESNMRHLQKSIQQVKNGQVVVKTMEELEAMALD